MSTGARRRWPTTPTRSADASRRRTSGASRRRREGRGLGPAVVDRKVPMGMIAELGGAFWQPEQAAVLAPFVDRYVEAMPDFATTA